MVFKKYQVCCSSFCAVLFLLHILHAWLILHILVNRSNICTLLHRFVCNKIDHFCCSLLFSPAAAACLNRCTFYYATADTVTHRDCSHIQINNRTDFLWTAVARRRGRAAASLQPPSSSSTTTTSTTASLQPPLSSSTTTASLQRRRRRRGMLQRSRCAAAADSSSIQFQHEASQPLLGGGRRPWMQCDSPATCEMTNQINVDEGREWRK